MTENDDTGSRQVASAARSVWAVSAITLFSRVLGLARDWCMVALFGAAKEALDAFLLAFTVPNLFRRLFGEGALAASFIPVFVEAREKQGAKESASFAGAALTLLAFATGGIAAAGILFCLGAESFFRRGEGIWLTLRLTAVMLPFLCLICCSALLSSIMQAVRMFSLPALMSVVLNVFFLVAFGYVYYFKAGRDMSDVSLHAVRYIFIVAVAVVLSAAAQLIVQWPALLAKGVPLWPSLDFGQGNLVKVLKAMGPTTLGLGVVQVNVLVDNLIAGSISFGSGSGQGAVQYLYLGNRLMQLPLGVFGIAIATTLFPYFSSCAARKDSAKLLEQMSSGVRMVFFIVLPAAAGLAVLSSPIVRMIFQRSDLRFDDAAVYRTALVLACYSGGLVFYSLQHLLTRVFYARGEYSAPVKIAAAMVGVNLALNLLLIRAPDFYRSWSGLEVPGLSGGTLGEAGLALATAITAAINASLLWLKLRGTLSAEVGEEKWEQAVAGLFWPLCRIVFASALTGVCAYWFVNSIPYEPELAGRIERGLTPVLLGAGVYYVLCVLIPVPELYEFSFRKPKK